MTTTTFTGPITAGSILETSGSTVGTNVANVGTAILGQIDVTVVQSATAATTNIVIPAGSTIVGITLFVTTAWDGGASTLSIGTSSTSTELATAVAGGTLGTVVVGAGADATRTEKWINVGTSDVQIYVKSANNGGGEGALSVQYIQGPNSV